MTVKELIKVLKQFDKRAPVVCVDLKQDLRPMKSVFEDSDGNVYITMSP